jgi:NADH:ubiquinone oxidoreductase subunit K
MNGTTGYRHHMFVKAFCILAVIFVGIGMVGIAIRRRRGL